MNKILALVLIAGCGGSPPPAREAVADVEMRFLNITLDIPNLKTGEWALYKARLQGVPRTEYYKWAVVEEDRAGIWIENERPADPRTMIVKSKFDRTGTLLEMWVGEPGGAPGKVYPDPKKKDAPPPRRDAGATQPSGKIESETINVGGKTYACTKVTTPIEGGQAVLVDWYSKEVPLGPRSQGGLVRRQIGKLTLELFEHGTRTQPKLTIPK